MLVFHPDQKSCGNTISVLIALPVIEFGECPLAALIAYAIYVACIISDAFREPAWSRAFVILNNMHYFMRNNVYVLRVRLKPLWIVSCNSATGFSNAFI